MSRITLVLMLLLTPAASSAAEAPPPQSPLRVLMTVGGVGYNTTIVRMLRSNPDIELTVRDFDVEKVLAPAALSDTDAVLMYHRDNVAEPEERQALMDFLDDGGGIVVLHHSIANYPDWEDWWRDHVGGLYTFGGMDDLPPSRYFYDFRGVAVPAGNHPITTRLGDFWRYADESYDDLWISDDVEDLLRTAAFGSETQIAWIGPSDSRRVVYIQPGHGAEIMTDPKYLNLIEDALRWSAKPDN